MTDLYTCQRPPLKNHKPMKRSLRAAQFAPFSALDGHSDEIIETSRITDSKRCLDDDQKQLLDYQLQVIQSLNKKCKVGIVYFVQDQRKSGGKYIYKEDFIKKIHLQQHYLQLEDLTIIDFDDIDQLEIK